MENSKRRHDCLLTELDSDEIEVLRVNRTLVPGILVHSMLDEAALLLAEQLSSLWMLLDLALLLEGHAAGVPYGQECLCPAGATFAALSKGVPCFGPTQAL